MAVVQKEIDHRERSKLMVGIWNMNYDHISWSLWWIFEYPNTTSVILGVIFSRNMDFIQNPQDDEASKRCRWRCDMKRFHFSERSLWSH